MNDAERDLISVAVSESIAGNTNSEFTYAFGDGENYPDVEAWPVLLRMEGTDQLIFDEEFRFELTPFLQKLETIVDHPVELKQLQIMYDENGMDIFSEMTLMPRSGSRFSEVLRLTLMSWVPSRQMVQ